MSEQWPPAFRELVRFTHAEVMRRKGNSYTHATDSVVQTEWVTDTGISVFAGVLSEGGYPRVITDDTGKRHEFRQVGHINTTDGGPIIRNYLADNGEVWSGLDNRPKIRLTEPMMLQLIDTATEAG